MLSSARQLPSLGGGAAAALSRPLDSGPGAAAGIWVFNCCVNLLHRSSNAAPFPSGPLLHCDRTRQAWCLPAVHLVAGQEATGYRRPTVLPLSGPGGGVHQLQALVSFSAKMRSLHLVDGLRCDQEWKMAGPVSARPGWRGGGGTARHCHLFGAGLGDSGCPAQACCGPGWLSRGLPGSWSTRPPTGFQRYSLAEPLIPAHGQ